MVMPRSKWATGFLGNIAEEIRVLYEPISSEDLPYIGLGHIDQQTMRILEIGHSSSTDSTKKVFQAGDILFGSLRPYFRKVVRPKFGGVCSTDITVLRARPGVDPRFLLYLVGSPQFISYATSVSSGTRMPRTNWNVAAEFECAIPDLDTQRKIGSILSAYDDLIENNLRRIAILEEIAQAIYREWFVEFRYPGHRSVKIGGSTQCDMPTGWVEATVGDIAEETRQSVDPCKLDPATPYVGLAHIPRRSIALCDWSRAYEVQSTKLCFQKGDILFGKIRPYFHKVAVAPVDGVCSSDTIVIRPTKPEYYYLVLCCVSSDEFVAYSVQTSSPGTKMPRANWELMRAFPIAIPSASLLKRFNDVIGNLMDLICHLVLSTRTLRLTRDLLLPRLISGELDVSDIAMSTEVDNL